MKNIYDIENIENTLRSPASVFYEYEADGGKLLVEAANCIEKLKEEIEVKKKYISDLNWKLNPENGW